MYSCTSVLVELGISSALIMVSSIGPEVHSEHDTITNRHSVNLIYCSSSTGFILAVYIEVNNKMRIILSDIM